MLSWVTVRYHAAVTKHFQVWAVQKILPYLLLYCAIFLIELPVIKLLPFSDNSFLVTTKLYRNQCDVNAEGRKAISFIVLCALKRIAGA